jgi:hypothetical protein
MAGEPLDNDGVCGVYFEPPANWESTRVPQVGAAASLNIAGYWIAAHVTAIGANPVCPYQQNRHPYTVTWAHTEVQAADVVGQLASMLRAKLRNRSDLDAGWTVGPDAWDNRIVCGLRSVERGERFDAFLNVSAYSTTFTYDWGPPGVQFYPQGGVSTIGANLRTASGVHLSILARPANWNWVCRWVLEPDIAREYYGRFHAYLRVHQTTGAAGDIQVRLGLCHGDLYAFYYYTPPAVVDSLADWTAVDLGILTIPSRGSKNIGYTDSLEALTIYVQEYGNGVSDLLIYDLVLIPADELLFENITDTPILTRHLSSGSTSGDTGDWMDIDGLLRPKSRGRWLLKKDSFTTATADVQDRIRLQYVYDSSLPPGLAPHTRQRLWWLGFRYFHLPAWYSEPWAVRRVQLEDNDSYLLARGAS